MREEKMDCKEICELLTAYLDGEVTPEERAYIEAHLPGCPQCRAELEGLSVTQENLRGAFHLVAEEASPSPQVWDKIRARLETKESRRGFWSAFTLGRVAAATAAVVILVIAVVVWQYGGITETGAPPPAPAPAPIPEPEPTPAPAPTLPTPMEAPLPFQWSVIPEEAHYLPGEPVEVKFSITNVSSNPKTFDPYPPEMQVKPPREDVTVFSIPAGTQPLEIKPGETITLEFSWDQKDKDGKQVPSGWYNVPFRGYGINLPAWVLIQYPQGAMEKTIELNQSQTVNSVTITLERVELLKTEVKFYAFTIPPGYTPPQPLAPGVPSPPEMVAVHAEYTADGMTRDAGYSGIGTENDGIRLIWDNLDPVPSDARELTFTITRFGDVEGPWEFKVPLE